MKNLRFFNKIRMNQVFTLFFVFSIVFGFSIHSSIAEDEPLGMCTYPGGGTASGYTKKQCDDANGTWVPNNPASTPASSDKGLVTCDNVKVKCDFKAFIALLNKIINFILFTMAVPIAAIMFAYAGVLLVTSGGSTEARTKAKSIFTNALIGLVLAAAAWIIVKTLLSILGYTDIGLFF